VQPGAVALSAFNLVGAENSVTLCDLHVLVYQATEPVSPHWPNGRSAGRGSGARGWLLVERSVRAVRVVMLEILLQHGRKVARSDDQKVVEALATRRPDEAFDDGVRAWRLDRGADDADAGAGEDCVEAGGELAVSVADQETELGGAVAEVHEQVAGLLGDPGAGGVGGDPGEVYTTAAVLDHDQDAEAAQEYGVDVGEVDHEDRVGLRREELSPGGPGPSGAGSSPALFKMFQTVEAATEWPRRTSSPWMRL
jgi:hypothetical protein